jgi:dolichol-phosphate mannosyltransferase
MASTIRPDPTLSRLTKLSVVIPARDEGGCIASTVEHLHLELRLQGVPHEIVVVDDGSSDRTWDILQQLQTRIAEVRAIQNTGANGFGRAVARGLNDITGDAVVIMMADESDDCRDVVRYWQTLNEANFFIRILFRISLNDTTNAFKAFRKTVIVGCRPLIAPHFNLTVEIPLKAIVRGYSWTVIPITWRNRRSGKAKLMLKEMGSRYLFIILYVWLEKYFSRGDYRKQVQ